MKRRLAPTPAASDFGTLAATHYENFPVGSFLVPRHLRRHVHRIYAFARVADDLADELRDAAALAAYREAFLAHQRGTAADVPLFVDLRATIAELGLQEQLFLDLLDAFAQDLRITRYADAEQLFDYCRRSADPVGRLVLRVFGHDDPQLDLLSDRICTALQLLNHLQDLGDDLRTRDRIYFPLGDLARHGVTVDDLRAPHANAATRALVAEWLTRTTALFREGWPLTQRVRGRLRYELRAIVGGAAGCVRAIRAVDHDVLGHDTKLHGLRRIGALLGAMLASGPPRALR
ncbi:MAG: squalene synthase HpnC [Planctomycetes bacterium]|nr:squalene synthase HpnC [Planctomycetota bacterium]